MLFIGGQIKRKVNQSMSEHVPANSTKKRPRRKRLVRRLLGLLLVLLVLAAAGTYAYFALRQEYTVTYTGYTASTGSISNALSFSGSLNLIDSTTHTASSASTVRTLYVKAGDNVREGDRLVRLSSGETVKADFDGRVNSVKVAEGDEVDAGASLVQVADFTHMKVSIRVDEYDIADVSVGQRCTVTATATEKTFQSSIADIDYISASTGNVAYYTATAYVDVDEGVYPGMQVSVTIPQEEAQNVVVLKMDALSFDETNSAFVYMYDENQELAKVPVEVGVSNGNYVEIKSGLKSGDQVYVEVKTNAGASGLAGLMNSMFGSQQMLPGENNRRNRDFSNYTPGSMGGGDGSQRTMPSGGFGGGGTR